MPMDSNLLSSEIKAKVAEKNPELSSQFDGDGMDWLFEAISEAVVEHIQLNMLVTTVLAGSAGSVPISGSGTSSLIT